MTREDRDWLTDDFPELRDAPPWVMEEMIFAQPQLVAPVLGGDRPEVTRLRDAALDAAAAGEPVVVTGCGTSEHAAMVVAELLTDVFRRAGLTTARAEARQALDAALDPRAGGICIAISHDGGTRATRLAMEAARESGATTGLITACAESPVHPAPTSSSSLPSTTTPGVIRLPTSAPFWPGRGSPASPAPWLGRRRQRHRVDPRAPHRPRSGRGAPRLLRPHRDRRPGPRPGERRRARPQDRRGRAHPHHRLPPRDPPARPPRGV